MPGARAREEVVIELRDQRFACPDLRNCSGYSI
jgi:hypothetical protein